MLKIMFYVMGALVGISLFAKFVSTVTVRRMVKEAAEIQKSNHKLMKLIKAKFEHASMVSDRVQNVNAFVDKYIYEYKIIGIPLNAWRNIPKKMLLVLLILGIFSVCESIRGEGFSQVTIGYIQWTSIFLLLVALIQFVSGENGRLQAARNYMVEYLENVCIHRYAKRQSISEAEEVEEESEALQEEVFAETPVEVEEKMSDEEKRNQQEIRIRAILEEFLA